MNCELVEDWDVFFDSFSDDKTDIYFKKKYLSLYETKEKKAVCIVCKEQGRIMVLPFLRSKIYDYYDFETAYGYGGPISNSSDEKWSNKAFNEIIHFLKDNAFVCGFIRLHPLLNNKEIIADYVNDYKSNNLELIYDRNTVAIKTDLETDLIWNKQICSSNRNKIRKAQKNQLVYKTEFDYSSYEEFKDLYKKTMNRLSADNFYYFDELYFESLKQLLSGNSFLGTVRKDGILICASIFMYSGIYGHYHLEGSDYSFSKLAANNYLIWNAILEMKKLGIKSFHLGGGTSSSQDDSLFVFKKSFSPIFKDYYICKSIFNKPVYDEICREWEKNNPDKISIFGNRLLKYRF